jgi:uncharacterized Ntn-hydrolase superfamily protein
MRHGTYSIVAFDPGTGQHGVAVQSHWFSVGALCAFALPGVGAVATQSVVEPAYGPSGLQRMERGEHAADALAALLAEDRLRHLRQVAFADREGRVAVHTGEGCVAEAGHATGAHVSCQANMMARDTVPGAMLAAFEGASGPLSDRLLLALQAAEAEGGDVRGRQSAAMVVVDGAADPWRRAVDLRIEDHADPIGELERLLRLQRAYTLADDADELMGLGRYEEAGRRYQQASEIAPESDELLFWSGLALAQHDPDAGTAIVRRAAEIREAWLVMLDRLGPEFAPAGEAVRARLRR